MTVQKLYHFLAMTVLCRGGDIFMIQYFCLESLASKVCVVLSGSVPFHNHRKSAIIPSYF